MVAGCVFSALKRDGYNIELVREYIKNWAYVGRVPKSFDQVYVFGKQLHAEDLVLQSGVNHIITDSPLMMQIPYAKLHNVSAWADLLSIANKFESENPSINIFLRREESKYDGSGRYENLDEAIKMDENIRDFMNEHIGDYATMPSSELEQIISYIKSKIDEPSLL